MSEVKSLLWQRLDALLEKVKASPVRFSSEDGDETKRKEIRQRFVVDLSGHHTRNGKTYWSANLMDDIGYGERSPAFLWEDWHSDSYVSGDGDTPETAVAAIEQRWAEVEEDERAGQMKQFGWSI
jgi:hypothetical protein